MTRLPSLLAAMLGAVLTALPALAEKGPDGLHVEPWIHDTFLDLREDFETAHAEGKRLVVMIEQRGCIYCDKMHEEVFAEPDIAARLDDDFYAVRINLHGDLEVTDLDGEVLSEKEAVRKWGALFTPTAYYLPAELPAEGGPLPAVAAVAVPGAFGAWTTRNMMDWVLAEGYAGAEDFQRFHARRLKEEGVVE